MPRCLKHQFPYAPKQQSAQPHPCTQKISHSKAADTSTAGQIAEILTSIGQRYVPMPVCPTGTPDLPGITHFNVSDLELVSLLNMQGRNWEKGCSTKYMALRKVWWTLKGRNAHSLLFMFLLSSNILLLNMDTKHSICKGDKLLFLPYKWISIDCTMGISSI